MKQIKISLLLFISIVLSFASCQPDELAFARPEGMAGTIYLQLESMGNYTHYLECLDKTDYAVPLTKGGSWTAFVPTDSAFEVFLSENNFQSVDDMPQSRIESFIKFSLVTDAYNTTTLTYARIAWYAGNSFRRRTQYSDSNMVVSSTEYPFVGEYPDEDNYVEKTYLVDESRGKTKTINYWLDGYVSSAKKAMDPGDYAFMFPGEDEYLGNDDMRVYGSNVEETNIVTENGIIYSLDEVLEPQPNYYQYVSSNSDKYSTFKRLIDRFAYFRLSSIEENEETGALDSVYQIRFKSGVADNFLAFEPNDENMPYLMASMDFTETHATSILAPTDAAYESFLTENNIITDYYSSYDDMPLDVLGKMLSMNFFTNTWDLCPSHYGQSYTTGYDYVDFSESEIVDRKFCSNGFLVGSNKVRVASSFNTVLGPLLLDTTYSIMLKMVQELGIETALEGTGIEYSILGVRNDQLVNIPDPNSGTRTVSVVDFPEKTNDVIYLEVTGDPDPTANRIYPDPDALSPLGTDVDYVTTTLKSIVLNQIVDRAFGDKDNYYQTQSGEYVYVNADHTTMAGGTDLTNSTMINVENTRETTNGKFYGLDKFVSRPLYNAVGTLTTSPNFMTDYFQFFMCLNNSDVTLAIAGTSDFLITLLNATKTYTLLIPTNAAVQQAVADGVIPNPLLIPSMAELEKATAKLKVQAFIKKHFIQHSIAVNGETEGTYNSLFFDKIVDFAPVYNKYHFANYYDTQELVITDTETGAVLAKTTDKVNILSKGIIIHQIDSYLK